MLPLLRNRFATPAYFETALEPWSGLRREIDRVFDSMMSGERPIGFTGDARWIPPMDVEEHDDLIRLSFELPGVSPEDVSITVENGVLTVSGEKKYERDSGNGEDAKCMHERHYGRFDRSLTLRRTIDHERCRAYSNGCLPGTSEVRGIATQEDRDRRRPRAKEDRVGAAAAHARLTLARPRGAPRRRRARSLARTTRRRARRYLGANHVNPTIPLLGGS